MFIIPTHILVCILFAPPSLLLFTFFTLVYVIFYYDSTFYYGLSGRKFCMTLCIPSMCIIICTHNYNFVRLPIVLFFYFYLGQLFVRSELRKSSLKSSSTVQLEGVACETQLYYDNLQRVRIDLLSISKRFGTSFEHSTVLQVQGRRQSRSRTQTRRQLRCSFIRRWALFRVHLTILTS